MHVVLYEPEIPQNTGNIVRTCAATGTKLHLIKPLGFSLEDKYLKRSGLDYWELAVMTVHDSFADLQALYPHGEYFFASTKRKGRYTDIKFPQDGFLVFGKETAGLPKDLLDANPDKTMRIPMIAETRSLNLSNSVAIVLYEALRQHGFIDFI